MSQKRTIDSETSDDSSSHEHVDRFRKRTKVKIDTEDTSEPTKCTTKDLDLLITQLSSESVDEVTETLDRVLNVCRLKENIMMFVTRNGLLPLITLLGRKEDEILLLATKAIFYIVQWERARTMALAHGVLVPLFSLLKCSNKNVVQNAVSSISELACYDVTRTMIISSPDSLRLLIAQLSSDLTQTQYVTACTISNLALAGDKEFNTFMIEQGVLVPLFTLLTSIDSDVLYATLCAMWNLEAQNRKYLRFVLLKLPQIISVLPSHNDKVKDVALEILEGYLENNDLYKGMDFILKLIDTGITSILYTETTPPNKDNVTIQKVNYIKSKLERVARRVACFLHLIDSEPTKINCAISLPYLIKKREDKIFAFIQNDWLSVLLNCVGDEKHHDKAVVALHYLIHGIPLLEPKQVVLKRDPTHEFVSALNNKGLSDVQFNVGGNIIYASKLILTSRSEYFRSLLLGGMSESNQSEIAINGIEYEIFLKILQYLYTYCITVSSQEEGVKLLLVADQYQLDDLKSLCEQELVQYISQKSVMSIYETAKELRAGCLELACVKWMLENIRECKLQIPESVEKKTFVMVAKKYIRRSLKAYLCP